jgi:alpha-beta hydrolase superfamily lysophospholipase
MRSQHTVNRRQQFLSILAFITLLHMGACSTSVAVPAKPPALAAPAAEAFTAADGVRLGVRTFAAVAQPKAVLIALHGFNDYSRSFEGAADYFAQAGIKTVAYDQRGFGAAPDRGQWAGTDVLVKDFLAVLHAVRREHPGLPLFVLGDSMGGAVAAVALAQQAQTEIAGVILVAPAVWARDTMPWYQRLGLWLGTNLAPAWTVTGKGLGLAPSDNRPMLIDLGKDPLVIKETRIDALAGLTDLMDQAFESVPKLQHRTLLAYGLRDVIVPRRPVMALLERWPQEAAPNFRFGLYPDGYHMLLRDLQRAVVWKDMVSWMLAPDASLPSGLEQERAEVLRQLRMPGG